MKQSRVSNGFPLMVPLVAIALLWGHGMASAKRARPQSETSAKSAAPPQQLSPEGQASLRVILQAGNLPDLRANRTGAASNFSSVASGAKGIVR